MLDIQIATDSLLSIVELVIIFKNGEEVDNDQILHENFLIEDMQNVIETCFGVLKNRWVILRSLAFYPIKMQNRIILTCCLLHNFLRRDMPNDLFNQVYCEGNQGNHNDLSDDAISTTETSDEWSEPRNNLA